MYIEENSPDKENGYRTPGRRSVNSNIGKSTPVGAQKSPGMWGVQSPVSSMISNLPANFIFYAVGSGEKAPKKGTFRGLTVVSIMYSELS
jgi:hypothetical protein